MKRSSSLDNNDKEEPSRKRVRFCNDTELIDNNNDVTSSSSSSLHPNNERGNHDDKSSSCCDMDVVWFTKKDLEAFRLAAMQVSIEAQQKLLLFSQLQQNNEASEEKEDHNNNSFVCFKKDISDILNNPLDITEQCDLLFQDKDETVRGLERLVNPSLGVQRKNQRQFVIRSVLIAQQLAKEQQQKQQQGSVVSPEEHNCKKSNVDHLIAQFLQKETGPAKLIAHLIGKADQRSSDYLLL